jgi:hypothetical protein
VRLPKSLFTQIQLYDPAMDSRKNGVKFSPALTRDGKVSSLLLATLGLDDPTSAKVKQAFLEFAQAYQQLEKSHTYLTNKLPDRLHVDGSYQTSITSAFPEEGKALGARLRTAVEQTIDKNRTDVLWTRLAGSFDAFNDFGARARTLVLHFDKDGSIQIEHVDEGSFSEWVAPDEVPEQFKPFVDAWKSGQNTDRKSTP